uniref:Uncharacterized protein n=1 Tax=Romanomermis culicivorax TaxID=13658 RepID=A0A915LAI8_ROMCU
MLHLNGKLFIFNLKQILQVAAQWCRTAFHQRHIQFADLYRYYEIGSSIELEKKYRCNPYLNGPYD